MVLKIHASSSKASSRVDIAEDFLMSFCALFNNIYVLIYFYRSKYLGNDVSLIVSKN